MYEKGYKSVSDSRCEAYKLIKAPDLNSSGMLFGGRLLEWLDEIAALAAWRHAGNPVTTASIEHLDFKRSARLNDIIVMEAFVIYVGHTSMEVCVDTYVEDQPTGMRHVINRAFFTEVCIDKDGKPTPVPYGLKIESISEQAYYQAALRHKAMRKKHNTPIVAKQ